VDFYLYIDKITFEKEGEEAKVDLSAGFELMPGDSSLVNTLSPAEKNRLSDQEKNQMMKYRPFSMKLVKVTGCWSITSFGELPEVLNDFNQFYKASFLSDGLIKVKK